jgi:NAD-dependent DNA ligase
VTYASLHNADQIAAKDLREGDSVQVVRAGDVIPYVLGPVPEKRDGTERPWRMPELCPRCGSEVRRFGDDVASYCTNVACPGRQLEGLVHFAAKEAMDIDGLSYARIQQLLDAGYVHDVADLSIASAGRAPKISWPPSPPRSSSRSRACSSASAFAMWERRRRNCWPSSTAPSTP